MHLPIAQAALLGAQIYNLYAWFFLGPAAVGFMALGSAAITMEIASSLLNQLGAETQAPKYARQESRIFRTRTFYNV